MFKAAEVLLSDNSSKYQDGLKANSVVLHLNI